MLSSLFHDMYHTFLIHVVVCHSQMMNLKNKPKGSESICCRSEAAAAVFFHVCADASVQKWEGTSVCL